MGTITLEKSRTETELIKAAQLRVKNFPLHWKKLHYSEEVDSLFVQISKTPIADSKHDFENDVIFNFDQNGEIISLEILDLFDVFNL